VDASGANVFLFASIWPETFSYVAHELCSMGLPVVCFDMGAQADLIHFYRKGTVIKLAKSRDLLEELVRVWEESYLLMNKFI
jgi:glycosyltransferase involved in cell wall biosynthesis